MFCLLDIAVCNDISSSGDWYGTIGLFVRLAVSVLIGRSRVISFANLFSFVTSFDSRAFYIHFSIVT